MRKELSEEREKAYDNAKNLLDRSERENERFFKNRKEELDTERLNLLEREKEALRRIEEEKTKLDERSSMLDERDKNVAKQEAELVHLDAEISSRIKLVEHTEKISTAAFKEREDHLKSRIVEFETIAGDKMSRFESEREQLEQLKISLRDAQSSLENQKKAFETEKSAMISEAKGVLQRAELEANDRREKLAKETQKMIIAKIRRK